MLIADCVKLIKEISCRKVSFVRRSANQAAHVLARASVSMTGPGVWYFSPPSIVNDTLRIDLE